MGTNNSSVAVHKVGEYTSHVWENGVQTDETQQRVYVCFKRTTKGTGLLSTKTTVQVGSLSLDAGTTLEQAQGMVEEGHDYEGEVSFIDRDEDGFFRVVLK